MKVFILSFFSLAFFQFCSGHQTSLVAALRNAVLEGYEKDAKPDGQVSVKSGMHILDFNLCAHKEVLTTVGYATFMWTDNRLGWNKTDFGGIDRVRVSASEVWLPDVTVYNMVGPLINHVQTNAIIFSSGLVMWIPFVTSQTHCDVNYANWPFGEQNCTYTAGSWTMDLENIDIQPYLGMTEPYRESPLNFDTMLHKDKYEILGSGYERKEKTYPCCPGEIYPSLTSSFQFKLKRKFENGVLMTP